MVTRTKCMNLIAPGDVVVLHRTLGPASLSNAEVRYTTYGDLGVVKSSTPVYAVASCKVIKYWHNVIVGAQNQWVTCEMDELEVIDHDLRLLEKKEDYLVAIDTSGSINVDQMNASLTKHGDLVLGAKTVVHFDTEVWRDATLKRKSMKDFLVKEDDGRFGRGGTDLRCVWAYAKKHGFKKIHVLTDDCHDVGRKSFNSSWHVTFIDITHESLLDVKYYDLVAIDISGSMGEEELDVKLKEHDDLIRKAGRIAIFTDKIEANWEGHQHGSNCSAQELLNMGCRGATDIKCVFEFAMLNAYKRVIIITDEHYVDVDHVSYGVQEVQVINVMAVGGSRRIDEDTKPVDTIKTPMTPELAKSLGLKSRKTHALGTDLEVSYKLLYGKGKTVYLACGEKTDAAAFMPDLIEKAYQEGEAAGENKQYKELQKAGRTILRALFGDEPRGRFDSRPSRPFFTPMW